MIVFSIVAAGRAEPIAIETFDRITPVDFQTEVLPLLRASCLACHNAQQAEGELNLETPAAIRRGGSQGACVVAGDGAASLLLEAAAQQRDELLMPPPGNKAGAAPLKPHELGLLKLWIDQGAKGEVSAGRSIAWRPLPAQLQPIFAAAVTRDGKFAACGRGSRLCVYHVPTQRLVAEPNDAHVDIIRSLAFDSAGRQLASGGFRNVKLWRAPHVEKQAEYKLEGAITATAISDNGRRCAWATERGTVVLCETDTRRRVAASETHAGVVTGLSFSADGKLLVSASLDKRIAVWNTTDGKLIARVTTPAEIQSLARVGSSLVVTGHRDKLLRVWDAETLTAGGDSVAPLRELAGHGGPITALACDGGGEFVSGSEDGSVRRWDAAEGSQINQYAFGGPVASVAMSAAAGRVAASGGSVVKLFATDDASLVAEMQGDPRRDAEVRRIEAEIAFAKSTVDLARRDIKLYAGPERRVKVTAEAVAKAEQELAKAEKTLKEKQSALDKAKSDDKNVEQAEKALAAAQQDRDVAVTIVERAKVVAERAVAELADAEGVVAQGDARLKQLETQKAAAEKAAAERGEPVRAIAFSADGKRLLAAEGPRLNVYDAQGCPLQTVEDWKADIRALAAVEGRFTAADDDGRATLYGVTTDWSQARTIGDVESPGALVDRVLAVDFDPAGDLLATGGGLPARSGELKIWSTVGGRLVHDLSAAHGDTVLAVAFSPDGELLASAGADRAIKIHRVGDGRLMGTLPGHTDHVLGLSWSGDGKLLASCGGDRVVKLWDAASGRLLRTMVGKMYKIGRYRREVTSVHFVGRSEQLVASSGDGTLRLHRTSSDNEIVVFDGTTGYLYASAVSDDGQVVVAGGDDGVLRVWSGQNRSPVAELP